MQKIHRHIRHESIIISGGFPCQDASEGNPYGKGLDGHRTGGGWEQMYRIIREVRPEYVFVENVSNLLRRGWGKVLSDLSEAGYYVWWRVIPAKNFGFPFEGERIYAVAFASACFGWEALQLFNKNVEQAIQGWEIKYHDAGNIGSSFWSETYPTFLRKDYGVPAGAHRVTALGNACIPLFPEIILSVLNQFDMEFFK